MRATEHSLDGETDPIEQRGELGQRVQPDLEPTMLFGAIGIADPIGLAKEGIGKSSDMPFWGSDFGGEGNLVDVRIFNLQICGYPSDRLIIVLCFILLI